MFLASFNLQLSKCWEKMLVVNHIFSFYVNGLPKATHVLNLSPTR